jgi:isoquinoline 1-oxidoreductase alpha subunit
MLFRSAHPGVRPAHPGEQVNFTLMVNGQPRTVDVDADTPLLWVLRDELDLKGSKFGCGMGLCGACTVHIDGSAARSCIVPMSAVGTRTVVTIEGIGSTELGRKVQKSWLKLDVMQCGYCQAGQVMSACALLTIKPQPDDRDIDAAMSGNICRCATYVRIRAAIRDAAGVPTAATRED